MGVDTMHIRSWFVLGGAMFLIAANALPGRKRMSPLRQRNGAKRWGRTTLIRWSPFMPLTRFSGEHYRQPCDQIERRSARLFR